MEHSFIYRIWEDPSFKEEFMKNPRFYLQKEGIEVPENIKVIVHENTDNEIHITIPQKPTGELSEDELEAITGGIGSGAIDIFKTILDVFNPGKPSDNIGKQIY
jgi:hypothetical protein